MSRLFRLLLSASGLLLLATPVRAHEVRPAYLELRQTSGDTWAVLWKVPALQDRRLGIYVDLPRELETVDEPRGLFSDGAYVERWSVRVPQGASLAGSTIRITGLEATRIDVLARIQPLEGASQSERLFPANPSFVVEEEPSTWKVSRTYLGLGFEHILMGIDHLLFVLALVLLVDGWRKLVGTITTFTLAHSLTLALASLGLVHLPGPPVEACIALSIAFVAAEIVRARKGEVGWTHQAPWLVAFAFGLLHGLGFAGALQEVGLPTQAIPAALLFFNVGVELGQLAFLAVVLGLLALSRRALSVLRRQQEPVPAFGLLPAYAIGAVAMFWVIERTSGFAPY